jgi:hypothetical protein
MDEDLENFEDLSWNELRKLAKSHDVEVFQRSREEIEEDLDKIRDVDVDLDSDGQGSETKEDSSSQDSASDEDSEDLSSEGAEEPTIGFDDIIDEDSSDSSDDSDSSSSSKVDSEGSPLQSSSARDSFGEDIHKALAGLMVSDLEGDEKKEKKQRLEEKYNDSSFAQNGLWYFEEEIMSDDEEFGPKEAFLMSFVMFGAATLSERPDIFEKFKDNVSKDGDDE